MGKFLGKYGKNKRIIYVKLKDNKLRPEPNVLAKFGELWVSIFASNYWISRSIILELQDIHENNWDLNIKWEASGWFN